MCRAADLTPTRTTSRRASVSRGRSATTRQDGGARGLWHLLRQSPLAPGEALYFNAPYFDFNLFFPLPGLPLTLNDPFPAFFPVPAA